MSAERPVGSADRDGGGPVGQAMEMHHLVLDSGIVGVWAMDREHRTRFVNPHMASMLGYSPEEMVGRKVEEFMFPEDLSGHRERMGRRHAGRGEIYEHRFRGKDGRVVWTVVSATALKTQEGAFDGSYAVFTEITGRKAAEVALLRRERELETLIDAISEPVFLMDRDGTVVAANETLARRFGRTPAECVGRNVLSMLPPDLAASRGAVVAEVVRSGSPKVFEDERAGRRVQHSVWPIKDGGGRVDRIAVYAIDVTEARRAEAALQAERDKYHALFSQMGHGFALHEIIAGRSGQAVDYVTLEVNRGFEQIMRVPASAVVGRKASEFLPPKELRRWVALFGKVALEGGDCHYEVYSAANDRHFRGYAYSPRRSQFAVVFEDVTQNKKTEAALVESRELLATAERLARIGGWLWDVGAGTMTWTDETYRIHGMEPGSLPAGAPEHVQRSLACYQPEDRPVIEGAFRRCVSEGVPYDLEFLLTTVDGRRTWIRTMAHAVKAGGRVVKVVGNIADVTEQKLAEAKLRASQEAEKALLEGLPDIVMRYDREGRHLFVSANVGAATGIRPEDFVGKRGRDLGFPDRLCRLWEDSVRGVFESGKPFETEFVLNAKGRETFFNWRLVPEFGVSGDVVSVLAISRDITAHRRAERDYQTLFREMMNGFALHEVICDAEGHPVDYRFLAVNPAFEHLTGLKSRDLVGRTVLEVMPDTEPHWIETYGRVALTGEPAHFENVAGALGKCFEVTAFRPAPGQFACTFVDVTERKQAEQERLRLQTQLTQAQKMESVGRLAGGVAHDFNNMLGVILGRCEIAMAQAGESALLRANLDEIQKAAERSADLTRQLLAFARKQTVSPKVLDLNATVSGMLKMLQRLIGENIELTWSPGEGLWPVRIDPSQVDQMLANLCVNARDAIDGVGRVTISTDNTSLDSEFCADREGLAVGEYVALTVRDSGRGMTGETMAHLFEPFFTTKGAGKGTGLGLATVYGAVKQNNGFIDVRSAPGEGAEFTIYLPRHAGRGEASAELADTTAARGQETILLVEDEPSVLNMTRHLLERLGYRVLSAAGPGEAMELAQEHAGDIHLLMTDVVMPEMNGRELARRLLSIYPGMKRLFTSGYTADVIAHHGVLDEGVHFIQKPFSRRALAGKVREALGKEAESREGAGV